MIYLLKNYILIIIGCFIGYGVVYNVNAVKLENVLSIYGFFMALFSLLMARTIHDILYYNFFKKYGDHKIDKRFFFGALVVYAVGCILFAMGLASWKGILISVIGLMCISGIVIASYKFWNYLLLLIPIITGAMLLLMMPKINMTAVYILGIIAFLYFAFLWYIKHKKSTVYADDRYM